MAALSSPHQPSLRHCQLPDFTLAALPTATHCPLPTADCNFCRLPEPHHTARLTLVDHNSIASATSWERRQCDYRCPSGQLPLPSAAVEISTAGLGRGKHRCGQQIVRQLKVLFFHGTNQPISSLMRQKHVLVPLNRTPFLRRGGGGQVSGLITRGKVGPALGGLPQPLEVPSWPWKHLAVIIVVELANPSQTMAILLLIEHNMLGESPRRSNKLGRHPFTQETTGFQTANMMNSQEACTPHNQIPTPTTTVLIPIFQPFQPSQSSSGRGGEREDSWPGGSEPGVPRPSTAWARRCNNDPPASATQQQDFEEDEEARRRRSLTVRKRTLDKNLNNGGKATKGPGEITRKGQVNDIAWMRTRQQQTRQSSWEDGLRQGVKTRTKTK